MKVLEFRDVTRTFPGPVPVEALKTCSFTVNDGDMVTIVGHSGSGKSTLLNLAGLLDRPSSGTVLVNDLDTTKLSESDRTALRGSSIGFVFQAFHLMPHRSVADNVALAGLYQGVPAEERKEASRRATGNLDSINSEAIIDLLTTLNGAGTTVVIITHNPEIAGIGNLRLRLHDGVVTRDAA